MPFGSGFTIPDFLGERYGVAFNRLYVLANMPIQRFGSMLVSKHQFDGYLDLLQHAHRDANLDGVTGTDRAQLIGDPYLANPTTDMWFNIAAFSRNLAVTGVATDGNSPRNFLSGPGYQAVDLGLGKGTSRVWTCDLTHGYIDINGSYRS